MLNKITLMLALLMMGCLSLKAQNVLNVHKTDGSLQTYAFSERPVITYEGTNMIVTTVATRVEFPVTEVQKLSFKNEVSGLETVSISASHDDIRIYDLNGRLLQTIPAAEGAAFSFDQLPAGIYMVRNGKTTSKIQKL